MILAAPKELPVLGPLFVPPFDANGNECVYFRDGRPSKTVYAQPMRSLTPAEYDTALSLGMRRSGIILYRPVCPGCRKCQPFRIRVADFAPSKSQRRVQRKCAGKFDIRMHERPLLDPEHLDLFARYQASQHPGRGVAATAETYAQFLNETVVDTVEIAWRSSAGGRLVGVGILDLVPSGVSTVYFFWDPEIREYSPGIYSALVEIDLCRQWKKPYYYLGYLVPGAATMNYKAAFGGGEVWDGDSWVSLPDRGLEDPRVLAVLAEAEAGSMQADDRRFPLG